MSSYQKAVAENLASMNAPASEWIAVETVGTEAVDADGQDRAMPVFAFPDGYTEAPSQYKNAGASCCCNLCGKDIKNVYWIQNDAKHWVMPVGSECVTHFGQGLTGAEVHKQSEQSRNRALLLELRQARSAIWKTFATKQHQGYGRTETSISHWTLFGGEAIDLRENIIKIIGKNDPVESSDGAITRWASKNATAARALIESASALLSKKARREEENARRKAERFNEQQQGGLAP